MSASCESSSLVTSSAVRVTLSRSRRRRLSSAFMSAICASRTARLCFKVRFTLLRRRLTLAGLGEFISQAGQVCRRQVHDSSLIVQQLLQLSNACFQALNLALGRGKLSVSAVG